MNNSAFGANIKVYAEKTEGYSFKTVSKHFQPYTLTFINNEKESIYFSSKTEVKYEDTNGLQYSAANDDQVFKKSRKREVGRYFWICLPLSATAGFITGASFFILAIPAIGIAIAGSLPYISAAKYNSKLAQDYYINNPLPLCLKSKVLNSAYVFLPKTANPQKIILTNLSTDNKKFFDLTVPVI